jgi:hypothetical protein
MNTGATSNLVQLDVPDGGNGYLPLEPPTWWCAAPEDRTGTATFIGRFHSGVTTATRVHYKGRVYHVDGITNRSNGRDVEMELTCHEVFD